MRGGLLDGGAEGSVFRSAACWRIAGRPGADRDRRCRAQCRRRHHQAFSRLSGTGSSVCPIYRNFWRETAGRHLLSPRACRSTRCAKRFERRANHFPRIEDEADSFTGLLEPGDDLLGALKAWLKREHGIVGAHACRSRPCRTGAAAMTAIRSGCSSPSGCRPSTSCAKWRWKPASCACRWPSPPKSRR